jgi:hypothetical protein
MKKVEGKIDLKSKLRRIPEFKGVVFWDITPILKDKTAFRECIRQLADHYRIQRRIPFRLFRAPLEVLAYGVESKNLLDCQGVYFHGPVYHLWGHPADPFLLAARNVAGEIVQGHCWDYGILNRY